MTRFVVFFATFLLLMSGEALAQKQATDTLTGRVTAEDSSAIPRAHIRVRDETGQDRDVETDSAGRYFVTLLSLGDVYELSVRAFGYIPFSALAQRADRASRGARIERNIVMRPLLTTLESVRVFASHGDRQASTPGDRQAIWASFLSERLPVDPSDLLDVASLAPSVVRLGPQGTNISIAGQSPDQNRVTVDGATYSGTTLPAEGVRSSGVITNSYDVSHGQFSGGELAATTVSGTNLWGGALSARIDNPSFQYGSFSQSPLDSRHRARVSAGGGGPLVQDRLFLFGALDLSRDRSSPSHLDLLDSATFRKLQLAPDSAGRFLDISRRLGIPFGDQETRQSGSDLVSMLGRVDYALTDKHTLTARLDWRESKTTALSSSPLNVVVPSGQSRSRDGGLLAQFGSVWSHSSNQLRMYRSAGNNIPTANISNLPAGQVQVMSSLGEGTIAPSSLRFGGTRVSEEKDFLTELSDDLTWEAASGKHRFSAGLLMQHQRAVVRSNDDGAFVFTSLGDFELGHPASFTRSVARQSGEFGREYTALYLGETWRPISSFRVIYGFRGERSRYSEYPTATPLNAAVTGSARFRPSMDVLYTPRLGFMYDPSGRNWNVDGGIGEFAGAVSIASLASLWAETAANGSTLSCIGRAAPIPQWSSYVDGISSAPSMCADALDDYSSRSSSVALFDRSYRAPRSWRGSLGVGWGIGRGWGGRVDGLVARGRYLPSAIDLNLVPAASFRLSAENDRPVFVGAQEIDAATGVITPKGSRSDTSLGAVRELQSLGQSWTGQVTASASGSLRGTFISFFYTLSKSRILAGGIPAPGAFDATTGGDPNHLSWADHGFAPKHTFRIVLSGRPTSRLSISAFGSLFSGMNFTPVVGADINGDTFQNDRAFVFDPRTTTDPIVARGMQTLLRTSPAGIRECLSSQTGRIATPWSCRTPWSPSLDLRADFYAIGNVNSRRLVLTLGASNVTSGLDYLLHGASGLRGWGQFPNPDATLLAVRGFDATRRSFIYAVNPAFGRPSGGGFLRIPFQLVVQARITFGSDPRYQPLMRAIEEGKGNTIASARASLVDQIRNAPALILGLASRDSITLGLTLQQRARLNRAADSLQPEINASIDSLLAIVTATRLNSAVRRARLQPRAQHARSLILSGLERAREILTSQQWAKLPGWLVKVPEEKQLLTPEMQMWISGEGP